MSANNNIQVAIKVRPLLRKEKEQKLASCWKIFENSIQLADSQTEPLCFDYIFDHDATNQNIFEKMAKHIIHSAIQGFNGTIFAYGQTSSGKTYTMMGDEENPGVMVLAAKEIFKQIENESDRMFLLRIGYIEIYNEKIYDLLNKNNRDLKIHETPSGNVSVNCEECIITCEDELLNYLCMGTKERTVGETNMNERSSRSHAIFRIIIESRKLDRSEDDSVNHSVLNLVDLAGSERAYQTGARGARLKEGGHINKSLHFLSNVIKLLSESSDGEKFINYRDSKLTRILQASLGGNALTSIICTIKPTAVEETQSTLSFAMRAKIIKNKPQVNEIVSEAAMMKRLEREINSLKNQLAEERSKNKSQIKVGQLEQRLKTEVVKIISSNSLHNLKHQKEKRRRTWCTTISKTDDAPVPSQPLGASATDTDSSNVCLGLPVPALFPNHNITSKLHMPKPSKFFTPQITLRGTRDEYPHHVPSIEEEVFEPAENCNFDRLSPRRRSKTSQSSPPAPENISTVSITPKNTGNIHCKLKIVENALVELTEFTNLENKLDIKHDSYDALKQRFELIQNRNAALQAERLKYIALKDDHIATQKNLEDCLKRCNDLENQISNLTDLQNCATDKIANYEKLFQELNDKIQQLEMENREAVCLDVEFQRHKNKLKLRESELLEALAEKDLEISKLQRSLGTLREEKLQSSKHELMQVSRDESVDKMRQVCVKCEDLTRLLEEHKKVTQEFDRLTLEYERLQLNYNKATEDATQAQSKLISLERTHQHDVAEFDELRAEVVSMRQKLEQAQREYVSLSSDFQRKSEAYESLNRVVDEERAKLELLQDKYNCLDKVCQQQQQTIQDIQKQYDAICRKYQDLQAEYEILEQTSTTTCSDCTSLQAKNESLQTEITELKCRVELAQKQLCDGPETKTSADSELEEAKQQKAKLQEELLDVRQQFEEMQKEYDDLSNQLMDQLQDGEQLKQQNIELTSALEVFRRQQTAKRATESAFKMNKGLPEAQINSLKSELNQTISRGQSVQSATQTENERRDSVATQSAVSESMRSSGLGFEDVDSSEASGRAHNLLSTFGRLAAALDEIELEYAEGQRRRFHSALRRTSQVVSKQSYRLIFSDIQEIASADDDCEEINSCNELTHNDPFDDVEGRCVYMQGRFARHKFKIMKSRLKSSKAEAAQVDDLRDSTPTATASASNVTESHLREENQQLRSLLDSMEQEINEMREKMTSLSAELLEKSLFVERCACQLYQKQIESLEKERAEMTILCEELQSRATQSFSVVSSGVSNENGYRESNAEMSHEERSDDYSCDNKPAESTATLDCAASEMSMSICLSQIGGRDDDTKLNETLKDDNGDDDNHNAGRDDPSELHRKIKDLSEEVVELQITLTALRASLEKEQHNIRSKDVEINELRQKSKAMEGQLAVLQKEHEEELKAFDIVKREELDCKQREHKAEISRLQLELCEKLEKIETDGRENFRRHREWEENRSNYEQTIGELQAKLAEVDVTPNRFSSCKDDSVAVTETDKQSSADVLNKIIALEKQVHRFEQAQEQNEQQLKEIESQLRERENLLAKNKDRLKETEDQLSETKDQLKETEERLKAKQDQWKETENLLAETKNHLEERETQLAETKDRLKETEGQLSETKGQFKETEERLKAIQDQWKETENLFTETKNHLEERETQLAEMKDRLSETEYQLGETKDQWKETEQRLKAMQDQWKETENLFTETKNHLEERETQLAETKDALGARDEQLREAKVQLEEREDQLRKTKEQLLKFNEENAKLLQEKMKLTEQINTIQQEKYAAERSLEKPVTNEKLKKTEEELSKLEEHFKQTETDLATTTEELKIKVQEALDMQKLIEALQADHQALKQHQQVLEKEVLCSKEVLQSKEFESQTLKNTHIELLEAKQELEFKMKSLQMEHCKLVTDNEALRHNTDELRHKLTKCIEERQQFEFQKAQLEREKENAEQHLQDLESSERQQAQTITELREQVTFFESLSKEHQQLQKNFETLQQHDLERERLISELRDQLQAFATLSAENVELQKKNDELRRHGDEALEKLKREKEELAETLKGNRVQLKEAEEKAKTLHSKIDSLMQELHELRGNVGKYEKILLEYYDVTQTLEAVTVEKKTIASEMEHLREQLKASKEEKRSVEEQSRALEQKLQDAQTRAVTAEEEVNRLREQLGDDHSQLRHQKVEMQSTITELQLNCQSLRERHDLLQKANNKAAEQLKEAQQQAAVCASLRLQLETLQLEKQKLATQLAVTVEDASQCSRQLRHDAERHKELLNQQMEAYNKLRTLLESKESAFKDDKKRLEGTIECLLAKEKTLEERLFATEVALKKFDELVSKQKTTEHLSSTERERLSPRSLKSFERLIGENNQLKKINLNLEDRLQSVQHKTSHVDSAERKNRRISTHDEHRRQSLWGSVRDACTLTDPTDATCNCVELDLKLKECEKNLFIRESQLAVLKMEIKNHPLKQENITLKKRLQEEQERNSNEIKKYKEIIIEQKTKAANALLAAHKADGAVAAAAASAQAAAARAEKPKPQCTTVHVEAQTDSDPDPEFKLHKLEGKYNDLKNICRFRYTLIRELEEKVASLTKGTTTESSNGNELPAVAQTSIDAGQIQMLKQQSAGLKKELTIYKQKYEEARQELENHRAVIRSLRSQIDTKK